MGDEGVTAMPLTSVLTHMALAKDRAGLLLMTNDQEDCRKATKCLKKSKHPGYSQLSPAIGSFTGHCVKIPDIPRHFHNCVQIPHIIRRLEMTFENS
jgi:hypothetical protein